METLLSLLKRRDGERQAVAADLEALRRHTPAAVDRPTLRQQLRAELDDWQALLRDAVQGGRQVLRTLLHGPLMCAPDVREGAPPALRFEGAVALDRVLRGCSGLVASPTGFGDRCCVPFEEIVTRAA